MAPTAQVSDGEMEPGSDHHKQSVVRNGGKLCCRQRVQRPENESDVPHSHGWNEELFAFLSMNVSVILCT